MFIAVVATRSAPVGGKNWAQIGPLAKLCTQSYAPGDMSLDCARKPEPPEEDVGDISMDAKVHD